MAGVQSFVGCRCPGIEGGCRAIPPRRLLGDWTYRYRRRKGPVSNGRSVRREVSSPSRRCIPSWIGLRTPPI